MSSTADHNAHLQPSARAPHLPPHARLPPAIAAASMRRASTARRMDASACATWERIAGAQGERVGLVDNVLKQRHSAGRTLERWATAQSSGASHDQAQDRIQRRPAAALAAARAAPTAPARPRPRARRTRPAPAAAARRAPGAATRRPAPARRTQPCLEGGKARRVGALLSLMGLQACRPRGWITVGLARHTAQLIEERFSFLYPAPLAAAHP